MYKIKDLIAVLEQFAPLPLQEDYDNTGLNIGEPEVTATGCLVCLDVTEEVLAEAISRDCNIIISHHPVIFGKISKLTGRSVTEKIVMKAIRQGIAIYCIHTNLDNVQSGVSNMLGKKIGLTELRVLRASRGMLRKLVTFCPLAQADKVREAIFAAGAGYIGNYEKCSFNVEGTGTFRGGESSNPFVGKAGELHSEPETRIETIFPYYLEQEVVMALLKSHPYEEVAYDIYKLENDFGKVGMGMIGKLREEINEMEFLSHLKTILGTGCIRHSKLLGKKVRNVAVCGGSGSFLINDAIREKADFFVTSDLKYHQFQQALGEIVLADVGHFESEQFTCELVADHLKKNFPKFAVLISETPVNPVNYF
jgi:dinuclear metal center YbgI/SA1388 family protein